MTKLSVDEFCESECELNVYDLDDYTGDKPRWCKGCGDYGVLTAVQQVFKEKQINPDKVVAVSGIGCSSRFPHYLGTYGFHGIHGRALTIALGVCLARPDLKVLAVSGDGDCFSIGAGHWVHAIRYNPDMTLLVLDNEVYALTKKQASPTTPQGVVTNTTPRGAYLEGLNPLTVVLGIPNVSFVAQTATWLAQHLKATFERAWEHKGLSFVRILQRCPVFMGDAYGAGGRNFPVKFLEHKEGIPVKKGFMKDAPVINHDFRDLAAAQKVALDTEMAPIGLIYEDESVPTYQEVRKREVEQISNAELIEGLNGLLDSYSIR
ncbi:MAG: 2-oxoglutarate oxidoreductase [Candidatus Dadabacteria bacterium]|nr:MAG: 2-oxoglutarate oxidoreductase [Candidatus Dadabacteria bacterium]